MTTKSLRFAIHKLDRPPIIVGLVVVVFLLAGLVAAAGRYTARVEQAMRPIILIATATAQPLPSSLPIVQVQHIIIERIIIATPTPEPAPPAPEPQVIVVNAPAPAAPTMPAPESPAAPTVDPAFASALIGPDPDAKACTGANGIVSPLCGGLTNQQARDALQAAR